MKSLIDKTYKGFMDAVDNFANCSTETPIRKQKKIINNTSIRKPEYSYQCDNYIDAALSNPLVSKALCKIADKYYGSQIREIIKNDIILNEKNFPRLWANYQHCCKKLNIYSHPIYITNKLTGINALSAQIDNKQLILISFNATIKLNDAEQRFILGHELGHIQCGHLAAHTIQGLLNDLNKRSEIFGDALTDLVDMPLFRWYRTSEFTADRAGFLCCNDLSVVNILFNKIGNHVQTSPYGELKELSEAYPNLKQRLNELNKFSIHVLN